VNSYSSDTMQIPALPSAHLKVRPDRALVNISVSIEADTSTIALGHLQGASIRMQEVCHHNQAQLTLSNFGAHESNSKLGSAKIVRLEGHLVLPLPEDDSFWERSKRVAKFEDVLSVLKIEMKKQKFPVELRRTAPRCIVEDVELFRPQLVAQLIARAKSYSPEGLISKLRFEAPIEQKPIGIEEVELALSPGGEFEFSLKAHRAP
jgi:hypothetical protein